MQKLWGGVRIGGVLMISNVQASLFAQLSNLNG